MVPFLLCLSGVLVFVMIAVVWIHWVNRFAIAAKVQPPPWRTQAPPTFLSSQINRRGPSLCGRTFSGLTKTEMEKFLDWVENQDNPPPYEMQCQNGHFTIRFPQAA
jgi:hypothetical protein